MRTVYVDRSAILGGPPGQEGRYRYWLERAWDSADRAVGFLGYNPSTADALKDDQTIRKEVAFARQWGYTRLVKGNLCAYRATDWRRLRGVEDPVGPQNPEWLTRLFDQSEIVVCAWGSLPLLNDHVRSLATWALGQPKARTLGQNQNGSPKHTLYLPYTTPLQEVR